ncbi:hypothetical protein CI1B_29100 [Bradyrhizobium ivorense]|uniref:Uncharacterized protein n=1 Tax=Bradyrhizobium ivorense TaxID=2511166 RepID=A0A508T350_9BRAD|nr:MULTISPECIES: hypothetical protein [Bradyrhizobium]QOZ26987.1 hypothetical protein XH93_27765 [Bradyrhizobium sp. CCBAU 51753]VIO69702.1 hypothetical protein CI1B_29100 [Bradyrhizobium ivorense]
MNSFQSVIFTLAVAYAVVGALLLVVLVYARLHWSFKAIAIVVTSAFYVVSFGGMRGLLGWASTERLPANFKLLHSRIVEPHSLEGDPGAIYLWVEEVDEDNRPSAIPRAFRIPYSDALAEQTHTAENEIKAGHPQGGRAADFGGGDGTIMDLVREYITPKTILETSGGDSTTGVFAPPPAGSASVFQPLPPPRMPPKDDLQ